MDVPMMKFEHADTPGIKAEVSDDEMSQYHEDDDIYEETGDLDFSEAQQSLWLSHIPRPLWESWASLGEDDEIELGTIRLEGSESHPSRISLRLHDQLSSHRSQPKEYNLIPISKDNASVKRSGKSWIFSEKDLPGYKSKPFAWNDIDEDGNPGQGRSFLYERNKREQKRKENKKRFEPYGRRAIPKQTAIAGTVGQEFDCVAVKNEEYFQIEAQRAKSVLKIPEKQQAVFVKQHAPEKLGSTLLSMAEKANINKQNQARKQAAKENRAARVDRNVLIDKLLDLFKLHRIWGLRDLKARVNQPEAYLREVLNEIAFMWKNGDFTGKWELKDEFKERDVQLMNPVSMLAPAAEKSEVDSSGVEDDDDENEAFEDV